ncbi:MAG: hypothetical protein IKX36_05760 [Prevotella sp.]|nr:hypothetical protein [Prevotella sp.]
MNNHVTYRRKTIRLFLFSVAVLMPLLLSAQDHDEYGWRTSNTTVMGYYAGGKKSETLTSKARDPKSNLTYTISYDYVVEGGRMEQIKRELPGSHYWKHNVHTVGFRGKVKKGARVRFYMSMFGGSGTLCPKYYSKRITFTPRKLRCYELGGEYREEVTTLTREQVIKDVPLSQSPVLDTTYTVKEEGMYMFSIAGGGMWDGNKKTEKPFDYYPGIPTFNVVVYLLVEGEELGATSTGAEVVPEPKATPVDDNVGAHYEEDNDAWNFDGMWPFAIPASVIAAIVGYGLTRRKGDSDESRQEQSGRCEMHIYKDFGNTLMVGDMPRQVYAKIVRKDARGGVSNDPALTSLIQITSGDDYLQVADGGMQGEWRTAWVGAPETANAPEEGIVTFRMGNEGGSYTNRLHFLIEAGEVIFGQPNLTLPAHYEKEARLPFVVTGIEQGAPVMATITDSSGNTTSNYSVVTEWNEKEQLYYAVIRDRVLDKEKDKGVPGKYLTFKLKVEAMSRSGKPILGELYLYRYYMGLVLEIFGGNDVKCFIEEYDVMKHRTKKFAAESGGKWYVPAETKCKLTLFDYDEAENRILQLAPIPKEFKVKAQDENKQYLADKVFVQIDVTSCKPGDGTYGVLRCTKAVLDAPNRVEGVAVCSVMQGEKKITLEQNVRLCSQPRRDFADNFVMDAALKDDNRITDQLFHIRSEIYRNKLVDNLFPLVKYIDMVIDGYDPDFGYDKKTLKTITRTYNDVFTGVKAGANAEGAKPLTLADDMLLFIQSWYETAKTTSQDLGLCGRLFLGFATLGCSEIVFGTVDTIAIGEEIYTGMKNYVDQGGDSIWGGFVVGAKVVAREYIMSKVMEGGMKAIGATARAAGLTPEKMKEAMGKLSANLKKPFSTSTKGAPVKAAGQRNSISRANSKARVKAKVEANKRGVIPDNTKKPAIPDNTKKPAIADNTKKPAIADNTKKPAIADNTKKPAIADNTKKPTIADTTSTTGKQGKADLSKTDLGDATNLGNARAKQNVNDLRAACEQYRANPTPENKALRDKLILKCQGDKQSMYLLKEKGDAFTSTRKDFNGHLEDIYKNTDTKVKAELSAKLGGKQVRTKNVSSKTRTDLKEGKTVTMDRDTTYQYLDDDGVWKTIDDKTLGEGTEKMVEQTYNRHFHEQSTGIKPKTEPGVDLKPLEQKLADKHAKKMDQTIIQNELTNRESYGKDVDMMLDKSRHGERMQDARQVGKAVENKGTERFEDARKMLNEADAMTDPTEKLNKQADAIGEVREGCRQEVKIMDQFTDSMDIARAGENGGSRISDKLRDGIEIMRMCEEGTLPVDQAEANLRNIGYDSFEDVCRDHAATITAIGS